MIRIHGLTLRPDDDESSLPSVCARALGLPANRILATAVRRKSVDARDRDDVRFAYSLDVRLAPEDEKRLLAGRARRGVKIEAVPEEKPCNAAVPARRPGSGGRRYIVAGAGPAGLFAALLLARAGARPLVVERGRPVEERERDVEEFAARGLLDPESNIQFGEGGAGTFSDGKLSTNIRDPRCRTVLEELAAAGAPPEILYQAKPHIGTDRLKTVAAGLRREILRAGGEFRFGARLADLEVGDGRLAAVTLLGRESGAGAGEKVRVEALVAAVGHSARDTFGMFLRRGVPLQAKPFSIGVRIEHPQELVDRAQYGRFAGHPRLGRADYKLVHHAAGGRSVYTFCMCPGGWVVPAASEEGGVVTNGMSEYARDGTNANAALLVGVDPADFGGEGPLAGVEFQRRWERAAFAAGGGGYRAPVQRLADFLALRPTDGPGEVIPTYRPGVRYGDVAACLPDFAAAALREALPALGRILRGFDHPDAILTAVETRSSSPVRVLRDEDGSSPVRGLYPAGEGAGYAGGIMSAAVDGLRAAERILAGREG